MRSILFVKKACEVCRISVQEFFLEENEKQVIHARVMVIKEMTSRGYDIYDVARLLQLDSPMCKKYLNSFDYRYTKQEYFRSQYLNFKKKLE